MKTKDRIKDKQFRFIKSTVSGINEKALLADGFETALIGYVEIFHNTIALYDKEKCIQILVDRDKMTRDEAIEFFEFNTQGASAGENTPGFATILRK
jgi:hypothetical protein